MSLKVFCDECDKYTNPNKETRADGVMTCSRCQHSYLEIRVRDYKRKIAEKRAAEERKRNNDSIIKRWRLKNGKT